MLRTYIFLLSFLGFASASLLAIDFGGEWTKASVIKPGVPFDVLLNRDSKRKIQSTVAWKGEERLFGSDAYSITSRFPSDSFNGLKILQGRPFSNSSEEQDPYITFYTQISSNDLISSPRGGVAFQRPPSSGKTGSTVEKDSERQWTNEELVAMQFSYIKDLADSVSGKNADRVRDVVLTVPPYYTQHERQALRDAVEIAGLKLHALVHDGTAVAVNYAMARTFGEEKEHHIIYDAGATSITATVVSFSSPPFDEKKSKTKGKSPTEIIVSGVGFDRSASGMEFDRRVRELLLEDFSKKHRNVDIRADKRGMARMWKEATRVKTILSANTEVASNVESVSNDVDFRSSLTRAKFEEACSDLKPRFARPIIDALAASGLKLSDISSVILTGGASRTPMIQAAVRQAVGESKIATNVNADEAAVLGAALYGASLSRTFKTKPLKVVDVNSWDVVLGYPIENDETRINNTLIFPAFSKLSSKKTIIAKRTTDFNITISYSHPDLSATPQIVQYEITGVSEALANMTERLVESGSKDEAKIKVKVQIDKDGFVNVVDAYVWGEIKDGGEEGFAARLKGFFGGGKNETSEEDGELNGLSSSESTTATGETTSTTTSAEETSSASASGSGSESVTSTATSTTASPTPTLSAKERSKIKLGRGVTPLGLRPMTNGEIWTSRDRLSALDTSEALRRRKSEALNSLESYLYRIRELLSGDEESPFIQCSRGDERKNLQNAMDEIFGWLFENNDPSTGELWDKKNKLESIEKPIQTRYSEREAFPEALSDLQQAHWATRMFLQSAAENATQEIANDLPPKYTEEELESITKRLKDSESWLNDGVQKQKEVKRCGDRDPVLLVAEMKARGTALQRDVMKLLKRKVPRRKKVTSTTEEENEPTGTSMPTREEGGEKTTTTTSTETTSSAESTHARDEL